ncbi:MAG TPA: hypothetical protein VGS20_15980 [Candidatus Acidoferrales bacterium]|nr:hypothetical protein [Candidatus Acidoferrales bacterium]
MKRMVTVVLMLLLGVVAGYAQQNPVRMKYSGSELTTAFLLQGPDTIIAGEEKLAGDGSLGQFTYRAIRGDDVTTLTITDACPNGNIPVTEGEGIFRFSDGSLMTVEITGGAICIDASQIGHLTETYQVTGGTGRFQNATGELSLNGTLNVVLNDASGNPLLLTNTGEFDGTVIGVAGSK